MRNDGGRLDPEGSNGEKMRAIRANRREFRVEERRAIWIISQEIAAWHWLLLDLEG